MRFETVTDYIALALYLACAMGFPKRDLRQSIRQYSALTDELHAAVPLRVFDMIVHTDNRTKVNHLRHWIGGR